MDQETQSTIGRRSRRKGKSFERRVAGWLRDNTRCDWQTTRNSGRTDLKGDVYCLDFDSTVLIECKHRKTWTTAAVLKNIRLYKDEVDKVMGDWESSGLAYLVMFRMDSFGLWIAILARKEHAREKEKSYENRVNRLLAEDTKILVRGPDQISWVRVPDNLVSPRAFQAFCMPPRPARDFGSQGTG